MVAPTLSEIHALQQLLVQQVVSAPEARQEFHASWVAKCLAWEPSRARLGLTFLAQPSAGDAWLQARVRVRCGEHDLPLGDFVGGQPLEEEFVCTEDHEHDWLEAEDVFQEIYFQPTPALFEEAKKKSRLAR